MFARFNKTLSARIVAGALCTMFLALALMVFTASSMLQGQLELLAQERQDSSMRVAWEVLKSKGDRFAIKDGKLVVGDNYVVNDNFEVVDRVKELVGGTATVFQGDMRVSTNVKKPDGSRAVGTPLAKNAAYEAIFQQGNPYRGSADILGTPFYTAYDPILDADGKVIGILYVGLKKSEFLEHVQAARSKLLQIAFGVGLAGALMIAWYLRRTLKPLTEIAHTTRALAEGRLDMDVPSQGRTDEVGEIARALDALRDALVERNRLEAEAAQAAQELQELEKNRITEQLALQSAEAGRRAEEQAAAAEQRKEFVASLAGTMEHQVAESMDRVTQALQELGQASETMRQGASATLASCALAADKSNIACENIEAIAAATEEMSASVREIERKIGVAAVEIEKAARQTSESTQTIASLSQASHRIGAVVELIQDIAEQTNLLALNATIEAARAGDAGRGFAVVASEVKGLATQTAKATQDISVLIGEIQAHTERSVATMGAVAQQVETVHEISSEISAAVREQAASTAEISRSTRVVVETVDVLNDEVENIKALAQAADQQAGAVVSSTTMLDAQSTSMASELAARLRDLRAA